MPFLSSDGWLRWNLRCGCKSRRKFDKVDGHVNGTGSVTAKQSQRVSVRWKLPV